ncbi:uncharacterized protein LOC128389964 [Panonychus citri]|uniref:uncharacterized protein LOC128389964 n=1 Tax=Panonychus citri TaxID=50023 RepID=UPI0023070585|nr:uncharacterized protein LOC128389964 [Panonychus citri]
MVTPSSESLTSRSHFNIQQILGLDESTTSSIVINQCDSGRSTPIVEPIDCDEDEDEEVEVEGEEIDEDEEDDDSDGDGTICTPTPTPIIITNGGWNSPNDKKTKSNDNCNSPKTKSASNNEEAKSSSSSTSSQKSNGHDKVQNMDSDQNQTPTPTCSPSLTPHQQHQQQGFPQFSSASMLNAYLYRPTTAAAVALMSGLQGHPNGYPHHAQPIILTHRGLS